MEKINDPEGGSGIKRIAITGPESTGKSTLAAALADELNTVWVPEYARKYINELGRPYKEEDLTAIAKGQLLAEKRLLPQANKFLICDTGLNVIKIWSEMKYGRCDPWILDRLETQKYDLYFLTFPDIAWESDPQREHPHQRKKLIELYKTSLNSRQILFVEIKGSHTERLKTALSAIQLLE